jgi:hypothetical protein
MLDLSKHRFEVILPSSNKLTSSGLEASFASDLLNLFNVAVGTSLPAVAAADEPDWADVSIHSSTTEQPPQGIQLQSELHQATAESLPEVSTIDRPEELIKKPPYWLIVRQEGRDRVVIEGSHGPSLSVLEEYLKKWCRGDTNRADRVSS